MVYGRIGLLILWVGVVGGCGELRMPKREPVQVLGGNALNALLTLSTNCVEVGEPLTITLTLTNTAAEAVVLDGDPPIDLAIDRKDLNAPARRDVWSADASYPTSFNPRMELGEVRTYSWHWVAHADFAGYANIQSGAIVRYLTEGFSPDAAHLYLGVHWYTDGEYIVTCDEMR